MNSLDKMEEEQIMEQHLSQYREWCEQRGIVLSEESENMYRDGFKDAIAHVNSKHCTSLEDYDRLAKLCEKQAEEIEREKLYSSMLFDKNNAANTTIAMLRAVIDESLQENSGEVAECKLYEALSNTQAATEQQAHAAAKQQLAAEQESRKRAEVRAREFEYCSIESAKEAHEARQRAEAAEARIKASQEQEPVAYANVKSFNDHSFAVVRGRVFTDDVPLYAQPPIPPDVAELQRDKETAMRLVAKTISENASLAKVVAELQRQLEEARKVPEGWKLVPVQMTDEMRDAGNIYTLNRSTLCRIWESMLSSAPTTYQPKE